MKLSVLMPVYNESATFEAILRRVTAVPIDKEIIVVDNCSTDGTRETLLAMLAAGVAVDAEITGKTGADGASASDADRLRVVLQPLNQGKGSSVRRALALARGDWVIVQDADLEYDPNDYLGLFDCVERTEGAGAVFGTRLNSAEVRSRQPRTAFYYGRIGLSMVFRLLYASSLSDVATCYKLMRRDLALELDLAGSGFDLDFEIPAKLCRRGIRIYEVPIFYAPRTELEGKKIRALRDGLRAVWTLLKYRFAH
jgi:glycosyltransferase involved in cell wall biosynthesis